MTSTFNFRFSRLLFVILLAICTVCPLKAQIAGGLSDTTNSNFGGNSYILGSVVMPNGSPVSTRISVTLQSQMRGEATTLTDDNGKFVFSKISPGIYYFIFQGDSEFESVNQEVEVLQTRNTVSITVRLRYKSQIMAKPGVINSALADVPKKALKFYDEALKLIKSKDVKGAIEQLKLAIAEYPNYLDALNELGVQYMKENELEKAEESLRTAIKIKSDAFEPLTNYGIVLFRLKWFRESEIVFRSALKIKEESPVIHFYLGRLLTDLEIFDEAEKEFDLALKQSGNKMVEVHRMLANLYIAKGENKRAVKALEKYLELNMNAPDAENLRKVISQLKSLKSASPKQQ